MPLLFSETPRRHLIWGVWHITESESELRQLTTLSEGDEAYLKTISHPEKRLQTLSCRALLQQLCKVYGIRYQGVTKDAETGKPYLNGSDWHTSFSHCRSMSTAIIHRESPVGIDVELIQDKFLTVQSKFMSEAEMAWAENDQTRIGIMWSAKEAMYKYVSEKGLTLKQIDLSPIEVKAGIQANEVRLKATAKSSKGLHEITVESRRYRDHVMAWCV